MRKSLFLSLTLGGLLLGAFSFHSCQKKTRDTVISKQKEKTKTPPDQTKTCPEPKFANKQVDVACYQGYACDRFPSIPQRNQNRIRWQVKDCLNGPYTATSFYAVYKKTGMTGTYPTYTRIASFQCNKSDMWYANPVLTNSSDFVILVANSSMPALPTTIIEEYYSITGSYFYYDTSYGNIFAYTDFWRFSTGTTAGSISCINVEIGK